MHDTMKIDPARLKRMREARGWTQEQLAEIAGLNARTVQRVEASGKAAPETGMALAAVLGCSLGDLQAGDPPTTAMSGRARGADPGRSLRVNVLWMVLAGTMFLIVFGYTIGKDMAKRDNAMHPVPQAPDDR